MPCRSGTRASELFAFVAAGRHVDAEAESTSMSISSIQASTIQSTSSLSFRRGTANFDSSSATDKTSMSKMAEMMSKLKDLEKTDPAKAKQVLTSIASKLNKAAESATGDDATHIKELAGKFSKAAESGDMSALEPSKSETTRPPSSARMEMYKQHAPSGQMEQVKSILQDSLSSIATS
jgi:hypothetical protein